MGVTINVQIYPALPGWRVELWYLYLSEWIFFYDKLTDSKGKVVLKAAASSYPIRLKVIIPAQTMGGIAYEAQERWKSYDNGDVEYLTFSMEEKALISTTLTLSAPDRSDVGEKFNILGLLLETESADPITFQSINHSYNGKSLGGSTTGVEGDYFKEVSIPESGVWTIKSEFLGSAGYAASSSVVDTIVAASPLEVAIKIAGSVAVGLALTMYSLS